MSTIGRNIRAARIASGLSSGSHIDCEIEEWPDPDDIPDEEVPL